PYRIETGNGKHLRWFAPEAAKNDNSGSEPMSTSSKSINRKHKNPDSGDWHTDATLPEESHTVSVDRLRNKVLPVVTPDQDNDCANKVRELELKIVALTIAKKKCRDKFWFHFAVPVYLHFIPLMLLISHFN
ncbi:unnamed protein product, partial [Allacma fusca]